METVEILKLLWPIILIQFVVQIFAIVDVARRKKTRNLTSAAWIVIIVVGEIVGPIVYFLIGRAED